MEDRKTAKRCRQRVKSETHGSDHGIVSIALTACAQPPGSEHDLEKRTVEGYMLHGKGTAPTPLPGGELTLFN
jgi:hypothetical protein